MKSPETICETCSTPDIFSSPACEQCWFEINRYREAKLAMDRQDTVEGVLNEFARQLKSLGDQAHAELNYLHVRQAAEDKLVELEEIKRE